MTGQGLGFGYVDAPTVLAKSSHTDGDGADIAVREDGDGVVRDARQSVIAPYREHRVATAVRTASMARLTAWRDCSV